jgi:hypothetical protein
MGTTHLLMTILFTLTIATILVYRIYKFVNKVNKLYNYYIISEKDKLNTTSRVPPINGECPTTEQLENL